MTFFFCFHIDLDHLLSYVEGIVCGSCLSRCTWCYGRLQNCLVPVQSHCQSDSWNHFRGNIGETSEERGGAHNIYGLFQGHRYHLELN